jgi:hypothetical protein
MLQGLRHKVLFNNIVKSWLMTVIVLVGTTLHQVWQFHQACYKLLTACSELVDNLGQLAVRTLLVDGFLVDVLCSIRFLHVYYSIVCWSLVQGSWGFIYHKYQRHLSLHINRLSHKPETNLTFRQDNKFD